MGRAVTHPPASNFHSSSGAPQAAAESKSAAIMTNARVFITAGKAKPFARDEQRAQPPGFDLVYFLITISFKNNSAPIGQVGVTQ